MKITVIKIGMVCLISTILLSACVKKEQPKHDEHEQHPPETTQQVESTPPEPTIVESVENTPQYTLEEVPSQPEPQIVEDTQPQNTVVRENPQPTPTPAPAEKVETPRDHNTPTAAPPVQRQPTNTMSQDEDIATEDDAVAAVLKAARPALSQ